MNSMRNILALDQSTSATKSSIVDSSGRILFEASRAHPSSYPQPGWVEQDPELLWENSVVVISEALTWAKAHGLTIVALGITNQRETVIVWDRVTGRAIAPAMGWQCLRGQHIVEEVATQIGEKVVRERTGLPLDPHFSASKIAWILREVPGARAAADAGSLAFGTVDSWLVFRLTQGKVHASDPSNSSRTLLYRLDLGVWDSDLLAAFGIPRSMTPEVRMSDGDFGIAKAPEHWEQEVPIRAVMGDSHAALFGLKCFDAGQAKATFGTGSSVMLNLGAHRPAKAPEKLATSVAWGRSGQIEYVLEGNIHHSGDTIQWLVNDLRLFSRMDEWEQLANSTVDSKGVTLVPAFTGLGAPHWDRSARGAIVGLTRGVGKAEVARAGLESMAFQVCDLLHAMREVSGLPLSLVSVDGGPTKNPVLMQFLADICDCTILVPESTNASIFGIACMAGLAAGLWSGIEELRRLGGGDIPYLPRMELQDRDSRYARWQVALASVRSPTAPIGTGPVL